MPRNPPLEKRLEKYAAKEAKRRGIFAIKLQVIGGPGWPDHTFFKDGRVGFIEYKRTEKSRFQPLQKYYIKLFRKLGFRAEVAWTQEQVDEFFAKFPSDLEPNEYDGQDL